MINNDYIYPIEKVQTAQLVDDQFRAMDHGLIETSFESYIHKQHRVSNNDKLKICGVCYFFLDAHPVFSFHWIWIGLRENIFRFVDSCTRSHMLSV